jgi:hypothetical protein
VDEMLAFFMNCFHPMDWLEKDEVDPHPKARPFLNATDVLEVCRDIASGAKHAVLES